MSHSRLKGGAGGVGDGLEACIDIVGAVSQLPAQPQGGGSATGGTHACTRWMGRWGLPRESVEVIHGPQAVGSCPHAQTTMRLPITDVGLRFVDASGPTRGAIARHGAPLVESFDDETQVRKGVHPF